jgi:protein TonB
VAAATDSAATFGAAIVDEKAVEDVNDAEADADTLRDPKREREDESEAGVRPVVRDEEILRPGPSTGDPALADTVVYREADTVPVPVGGEAALQRMFRYPDTAAEGGVTGTVEVDFVVDQRGRVLDPQIAQSVGAGCDEEAERVVRLSRFRPATREGLPVRFRMTVQVQCAGRSEP